MSVRFSNSVIDLIETASAAKSPAEVGRVFLAALRPFGARAIYARSHRSAATDDEFVFSRISPRGWDSIYSEKRYADANYLTRAMRERVEPFRWTEVALITDAERGLRNALLDYGVTDGIAAPMHGPKGYVGVTSLAFERLHELAPADRLAISMAAMALHLRMRALSPVGVLRGPRLSPRERDCVAFVAGGKSDWEISEILGVAETTVISHIQNARRKLGAKTRAQAVALCLAAGLL